VGGWENSLKNIAFVIPTKTEESLLLSMVDIGRTVLFGYKKNQKVLGTKNSLVRYCITAESR